MSLAYAILSLLQQKRWRATTLKQAASINALLTCGLQTKHKSTEPLINWLSRLDYLYSQDSADRPNRKVYSVWLRQEKPINSVASMPSALADSTRTAACSVIFSQRSYRISHHWSARTAAARRELAECIAIKLPSLGDQFAVASRSQQLVLELVIQRANLHWLAEDSRDVINHH